MSLFNISIITATASSIGTDGYNLQHQKRLVFHWKIYSIPLLLPQMTMNLKFCLFLFMACCIILTKYFEVPYGGDPIVDTTALIG